eukprot:22868-Eustigmatos_ZCMA.PRE.1
MYSARTHASGAPTCRRDLSARSPGTAQGGSHGPRRASACRLACEAAPPARHIEESVIDI